MHHPHGCIPRIAVDSEGRDVIGGRRLLVRYGVVAVVVAVVVAAAAAAVAVVVGCIGGGRVALRVNHMTPVEAALNLNRVAGIDWRKQ